MMSASSNQRRRQRRTEHIGDGVEDNDDSNYVVVSSAVPQHHPPHQSSSLVAPSLSSNNQRRNPWSRTSTLVVVFLMGFSWYSIDLATPTNWELLEPRADEGTQIDFSTRTTRQQRGALASTISAADSLTTSIQVMRPRKQQPHPSIVVWKNDYNLVHVVLTRFMQHQPHLLHLGRARLELFRTFCLPTMVQQTSKQFLWIIRVDPDLHPDLKTEFLHLLQSPDVVSSGVNVLVVGSNARIDNGHFRTVGANSDIQPDSVWYGSCELFRSYFRAAQNKVTLETGLDADDGLALHFIQDLQTTTSRVALGYQKVAQATWWRIWCIESSDEWQYYGNYLNSSYGSIVVSTTARKWCLTPGLTRASTPDHKRYKESMGQQVGGVKSYHELKRDGMGFFIDHYYIKGRVDECPDEGQERKSSVGCFRFFSTNYTQAIRARSPTSAGMKDIQTTSVADEKKSRISREMNLGEKHHWDQFTQTFGVPMQSIRESRDGIEANLPRILEDALSGQCTEGHTCKDEAKNTLLRLLNATRTS